MSTLADRTDAGRNDPTIEFPWHDDGIYFGLDEARYHGDPALGSTDMKKLWEEPAEYWWDSAYNPDREPEKSSDARVLGTALHTFVLYGRHRFETTYAPAWLDGSRKEGKDERAAIRAAGRIVLPGPGYKRVAMVGTTIGSNPYLRTAFQEGHSEVSVFWTPADGIRRKARFDYLRRRAVADLKSLANTRDISFRRACKHAIEAWNYPMQMEHYREAREAMAGLVRAGAVWLVRTGPAHGTVDPAWVEQVANHPQDDWAWVWVFWQSNGAPLTHGIKVSPANDPVRTPARVMLDEAARRWRTYEQLFGLGGTPWVEASELEELDITDLRWWGRDVIHRDGRGR